MFVVFICYLIIRFTFTFRYRIQVKGLENLTPETLSKKGGVLFLPNHPSQLDPVMVTIALWKKFKLRPLAVEYVYYTPGINWLLNKLKGFPIPDFEKSFNTFKEKRKKKTLNLIADSLQAGDNFLIYPGGRLKHTHLEVVGGNSGVQEVLEKAPDANVVMVKVSGLWGSIFSRALKGKVTPVGTNLLRGIGILLKNLIFFTPRREVTIEFTPVNDQLPPINEKRALNQFFEHFYNAPNPEDPRSSHDGESLALLPHYFWSSEVPTPFSGKSVYQDIVDISNIPTHISQQVKEELAKLADCPIDSIQNQDHLSSDLGLDSLSGAELIAFLEDNYRVKNIHPSDLTTVSRVIAIANGQVKQKKEIFEKSTSKTWNNKTKRPPLQIRDGETICESFLNLCNQMSTTVSSANDEGTILTYKQMKLRIVLLAEKIKAMPGSHIGILLPASHAAYMLIFACQLAGKTPVMINWTVGAHHLDAIIKSTQLQVILSAWKFLDSVEGVDFGGHEDKILLLEELAREWGLFDKIKALYNSKKSTSALIRYFGLQNKTKKDVAVILFTSGTESLPKGVPLTHDNILSNLKCVIKDINLSSNDILLAILPPFHSFGFSITGLFPLLSGMRVIYSPDPTRGTFLANVIEQWKVSIVCSAPTFLRGILRSARHEQLESVRLFLAGAEKLPEEIRQLVQSLPMRPQLLEGYGITEGSPVISVTPLNRTPKGVGLPLSNIDIKIVHPETYDPIPLGERGLILAKGPNFFSGYLEKPASEGFYEFGNQRWYITGDLGYLDEEGHLYISGRLKRFVKVGGEMISLESIETALLEEASNNHWEIQEEGASLAICAEEKDYKVIITLFTTFKTDIPEVNRALRKYGFSNLVKIQLLHQVKEIPILGTGKTNYRGLQQMIPPPTENS